MKNNKVFLGKRFTLERNEWHGTILDFSRNFTQKYQGNSFEKDSSIKKLKILHNRNLEVQKGKADRQIDRCKQLNKKLEGVNTRVNEVNLMLREQQAKEYMMNHAAIIIQKHLKGYLTRKHLESVLYI